jgi:hypothetical protein
MSHDPGLRPVLFYAHHQGRGHVEKAAALAARSRHPFVVATSVRDPPPGLDVLALPDDADLAARDPTAGGALHWAPLGSGGHRARLVLLADWIAAHDPALAVVDVSQEIVLWLRLLGVPVVAMRQPGTRDDAPHRTGLAVATALLAPFPLEFEDPATAPELARRTFHAGGFSRWDGMLPDRAEARERCGMGGEWRDVVVLLGAGGGGPPPEDLGDAARATPGWRWTVVGTDGPSAPGLRYVGRRDDAGSWLRAADVAVAATGHASTCDVAAAGTPLVTIPADRPFGEQEARAARLHALDLAEVAWSWPPAARWPAVLERAVRRGGGELTRVLCDGGGAARAAVWLDALADAR